MKAVLRGVFFQACLILIGALGATPPATAVGKRVALVVGIGNYTYSPQLANPKRDAQGVADALKRLGFDVVTALDSDLRQLESSLDTFYARSVNADAALFYYAGHGLQLNNVNYIVPKNAELRSEARVRQETIALQEIISTIERRATITLVFLDACRDNPLAEDLQRSVAGASRSAAVPRGLAVMEIRNPNTFVVYAAAPGRTASDGSGQNSPFASALLSNINQPGLEIETLMKRVTRDVSKATNGQQIPERFSRLTSDFVFNETGAAIVSDNTTRPQLVPARPRPLLLDTFKDKPAAPKPQKADDVQADGPGSAHDPKGCISVPAGRKQVSVVVGSVLCSEDGSERATIVKMVPQALVYSVNGVETACKLNDLCQFNWARGPLFRVLVFEGPTEGVAMGAFVIFAY